MRHLGILAAAAGFMLTLPALGQGQQSITVEAYRADGGNVRVYDETGQRSRLVSTSALPAVPAPVFDVSGKGVFYRLETVGGPVWLNKRSAVFSQKAQVLGDCEMQRKLDAKTRSEAPSAAMASRGLGTC